MSTRRPSPSPSHSPSRSFSPHPPTGIRTLGHPRLPQRHTHRRTPCAPRQAARIEAEVDTRDSRIVQWWQQLGFDLAANTAVREREAKPRPPQQTSSAPAAAPAVAPPELQPPPAAPQGQKRSIDRGSSGGPPRKAATSAAPAATTASATTTTTSAAAHAQNTNTKRTARTETVVPDSAAALVGAPPPPPLAESAAHPSVWIRKQCMPGQPHLVLAHDAPANGAQDWERVPDAELTREHRVECQVCKKAFKISRKDALSEMQGP